MQPPKITSRRWFWGGILATGLWALIGGRTASTESPHTEESGLHKTQRLLASPLDLAVTPPRWILRNIQGVAVWAVARVSAHNEANESLSSLHEEINELKDEIDQRDRKIRIQQDLLNQLQAVTRQGLKASDMLPAAITGGQTGAGTSVIILDKGTADGVERGMVVAGCETVMVPPEPAPLGQPPNEPKIALMPQASVLGLVDGVSAKTCTVRLMTDPRMKTGAVIVRRRATDSVIISPPCLVEGMGDGTLRCNTIDVGKAAGDPIPGDLVELDDRNWPAGVRYMIIGEVTSVGRKDTQILRYDLAVAPRVNVNAAQTVLILLNDQPH